MKDLIESAVRPICDSSRCVIEGDAVDLTADQGLALSMALHELATNAIKYGALSNDEGRVAVDWSVSDGQLRFRWTEAGGPQVIEPVFEGFGTKVMTRNLEAHFGGSVSRFFKTTGLVFELTTNWS